MRVLVRFVLFGFAMGCAEESLLLGVGVDTLRSDLAWPVSVNVEDIGCSGASSTGTGRGPVTWALRFTATANPSSSVVLHMGENDELALDPATDVRWIARNVDSFDTGGYDASTHLGFYVVKLR